MAIKITANTKKWQGYKSLLNGIISNKNSLRITLLLLLLLGMTACLTISFSGDKPSSIQDLTLNVAASFIVIVITILVFDGLEALARAAEWKDVRGIAMEELEMLSHASISYVSSPFGMSVLNFININPDDVNNPLEFAEAVEAGMNHLLVNILQKDLSKDVAHFRYLQWNELHTYLVEIGKDANELVNTYRSVLPPKQFAKILGLRRAIRGFLRMLELMPALFTDPKFTWESVYGDVAAPENNTFTQLLSDEAKIYFRAAKDLRTVL